CDRVAVMEHGRLVALGTPAELTRQFVKRLDVDLEVEPSQTDCTLQLLQEASRLVLGSPKQEKNAIVLTVSGREAIPELLSLLVQNDVRLYAIAPREADLEEVYFALHGDAS
ncbi:MAG: ABC transporter ATP-binding protein, partial [Bacteroidota bacterium]